MGLLVLREGCLDVVKTSGENPYPTRYDLGNLGSASHPACTEPPAQQSMGTPPRPRSLTNCSPGMSSRAGGTCWSLSLITSHAVSVTARSVGRTSAPVWPDHDHRPRHFLPPSHAHDRDRIVERTHHVGQRRHPNPQAANVKVAAVSMISWEARGSRPCCRHTVRIATP